MLTILINSLNGLLSKSKAIILSLSILLCLSSPVLACLEIPTTPPETVIETCVSIPGINPLTDDFTILRLLDYSTYGANTDEYCACALNLPFQFGIVDSAAIVYSGTNTLVQGWDFSSDFDTGFGPSGDSWQGFSSAVTDIIPSGIEVDVVFIITANCEVIPSREGQACCDDRGLDLQDWFENGNGLVGTDGANADGSPAGEHTYVDTVGNIVVMNPSCFDGIINGNEEGNILFFGDPANCGGSECVSCDTQFLELMDPCSCESTYVAGLGFQDTLRILTIPGSTVQLDVNNGGFDDQSGMPFVVGTMFVDGGAFDDDGIVNGEIVVPFYRDETESADIVVDGVAFMSPAPCPLLTDCNICDVEGGTITGGPFQFCVGDDTPDFIAAGDLTLTGNAGPNSSWVVTDDQLNILGLPASPDVVDFDNAGNGTCLIWHISFEDDLVGAEVGQNAADLSGCFSLSNSISVVRELCNVCDVEGGSLTGGPYDFCVGDDNPDFIPSGDLILTGNAGPNSAWVVTDDQLNILGLPASPDVVDFDNAGNGTCLIWHISFEDDLVGADVGQNAADLSGCFSLSNSIVVNRNEVNGGTLEGGPFTFCVGNGGSDFISSGELTLTGNVGTNSAWVVTDEQLNILGLPAAPEDVDFENAGNGTCLIWHISFEGDLVGAEVGQNAADLSGCFSLSNSIAVNRNEVNGGTLTGGPFTFCVGDGIPDFIMSGDLTVSENVGTNSSWVVTDDELNILGLPNAPEEVDFEEAGSGVCLIWFISFEDDLIGAEVGSNVVFLQGCFSLSDPVIVNRNGECCLLEQACSAPDIASLFDSSDAEADINAAGLTVGNAVLSLQRQLSGTAGFDENEINASQTQGDIAIRLGVGNAVGASNSLKAIYSLSNDVCDLSIQIWDLDQTDEIVLQGFSNGVPVTYTTNLGSCVAQSGDVFTPDGGACEVSVSGDQNHSFTATFDECIDAFEITIYDQGGGTGGSYSLVIGEGCTEGALPEGGTLSGGPFEFCAGDGEADFIMPDELILTGASGVNTAWVVTDDELNILGLPASPENVNFDGAGFGTCLIWHLSFEDGLIGAEIGANASNLQGCFDLSNSIEVVRSSCCPKGVCNTPDVASLNESTNAESDFNSAMLTTGNSIISLTRNLTGSAGFDENDINDSQTNGEVGIRLGVADAIGVANSLIATYDMNAPVCNQMITLWDVDETDELIVTGSLAGIDAAYTTVLGSCIAQTGNTFRPDGPSCEQQANPRISHTIEITFTTCIDQFVIQNYDQGGDDGGSYTLVIGEGCEDIIEPDGGVLTGGPYQFCVGDDNPDFIMTDDLTLTGNIGSNSAWVITDENLNILGLPSSPEEVDFEGAGSGTCLIWNLSFDGEIIGAEIGANAADLIGCFSLSNSVSVVRNEVAGGTITGGPYEFCVGDGNPDFIMSDDLTLSGNVGTNSAWVITDDQLNILGLPTSPELVDFEEAGAGTCLIWHLSFEDGIMGAEVGMNAADLQGCFSLSNSISVVRNEINGGTLTGGPYEFCVGDGEEDFILSDDLVLSDAIGTTLWLTTNADLLILDISSNPASINFDNGEPGECLLWAITFNESVQGLVVGESAMNLSGCFELSNSISIIKEQCNNNCEENLLLEGSIDPNLYEASNTITSNGIVDQTPVEFSAGQCISLEPNFEVSLGNMFHAFIEGCTK